MRILGVDPGSRRTGFGLIESDSGRLKHVQHGIIAAGNGDLCRRLLAIFEGLQDVIRAYNPQEVAMEDVFMSKNARSALKLGQARGALISACGQAGLCVAAYSPAVVKQAVVGFGRAEKGQVQHMVRLLLHLSGDIQEDAADALAVAVCHANHAGGPRLPTAAGA